jgi:carbonic anhydrase
VNTASVGLALARNREFAAARRHEGVVMFPVTMFVITCVDPRVDPAHVLGLELGEAIVVRNGGGRVTAETLETVAFIAQVVENFAPDAGFEVAVIHHSQCGAGFLADDEFRERYAERIGAEASGLIDLAVVDPVASVVTDVDKLRAASAMFPGVTVSGHVYDVTTGLVETVRRAAAVRATDMRSA